MRNFSWTIGLAGAAVVLAALGNVLEAQTATQTVTFRVVAASRATVGAPPAPLTMRSTAAAVGAASYAITTNEANQKITASLDRPLPAGVDLSVALTPPAGARSVGAAQLGSVGTDVLTGIPAATASGLPVVYRVSAGAGARAAAAQRTVTYTIVAGQ
jgi:hypothetical protein